MQSCTLHHITTRLAPIHYTSLIDYFVIESIQLLLDICSAICCSCLIALITITLHRVLGLFVYILRQLTCLLSPQHNTDEWGIVLRWPLTIFFDPRYTLLCPPSSIAPSAPVVSVQSPPAVQQADTGVRTAASSQPHFHQ